MKLDDGTLSQYLTLGDLLLRYRSNPMRLWRLRRRKVRPFPEPAIHLGPRTPLWLVDDVNRWDEAEAAAGSAPPPEPDPWPRKKVVTADE